MAGTQAEIDALLAAVEAEAKEEQSAEKSAARAAMRGEPEREEGPAVQVDGSPVPPKVQRILRLRVPLMVVLAERKMPLREILRMSTGSIIEFSKPFDEELELLANNRSIAFGMAVKVGENFGLRIGHVADVKTRIGALGSDGGKDGH
jgi:flagellar motor switch/type III secretory pathway protein FliN